MKTASLVLALAGLTAAVPVMAQSGRLPASGDPFSVNNGTFDTNSGSIIGAPIALHNYLHFKQAADKLHADFLVVKRQDGGTLTPAHDAELRARYFDLNRQIRNGIDTGRT